MWCRAKAKPGRDQSSIEQICSCLVSLAGLDTYFTNYRKSGESGCDWEAVERVFRRYIEWLGRNMLDDPHSQVLTKHCRLAITIMINEYHSHVEVLDTCWEAQSRELRDALDEVPMLDGTALQALAHPKVDTREALDIAYCFHIVPACDGRMTEVYEETLAKYAEPNEVDEVEHERFVWYCQAILLIHGIQRCKQNAEVECDE